MNTTPNPPKGKRCPSCKTITEPSCKETWNGIRGPGARVVSRQYACPNCGVKFDHLAAWITPATPEPTSAYEIIDPPGLKGGPGAQMKALKEHLRELHGPFRVEGDNPPMVVAKDGEALLSMMWPVHEQSPEGEAAAVQYTKQMAERVADSLNFTSALPAVVGEGDLGAEVERLKAELEAATNFCFCAYCGTKHPKDAALILEHAKNCPKSPLSAAVAELAREKSAREQAEMMRTLDRNCHATIKAELESSLAESQERERRLRQGGVGLIASEREQQFAAWTAEHDDEHNDGELAHAAAAYAIEATGYPATQMWIPNGMGPAKELWPFGPEWWKPSDDPIRDLVKAGALIAAEIDRLQRAALTQGGAK